MKFIRDTKSVTADDLMPETDIDLKALAEVQDDAFLESIGGLGALLRY